ncbi:recombinase family protein [Alteromonas sp. CI.11.F.A3]|uniref:recombinase family protein n=1 Tax=Alteromonas sp. CI.11.F.A3 TaxID=3079555 RepID=UPI002943E642|nr:recombinase family protein [Alteromonas sp. CI.11.F.A3]WOI39322.1 recombinase family protein [Alteromonas sp. CI.11.F.A3]
MSEKYIAYLRVSTKDQGRSGLGLEAQRRDINLFITNYVSDGNLVDEYTDIVSGNDSSRQALTEAILRAKHLSATLIVSKLDRLSRKVSFIATLMEDNFLKFKVASMPNADKFQLHIYAALAEQERDFISIRTKAALLEKKEQGAKLGGLRDKTNARNRKKTEEANKRAVRLLPLLSPMIETKLSYREMANRLNQIGLRTDRNKLYSAQTVRNYVKRCQSLAETKQFAL